MSTIKGRIATLFRRINYACQNLTVHGPRYIVRKDIHWIYRLIYFAIYLQVWIAAVASIRRYYNHYQENTIRFTTRTDYLDWNTTFPSITVCEIINVEKLWAIRKKMGNNDTEKLDHFLGDIAFFSGTCYSCTSTCKNEKLCNIDYTQFTNNIRATCKELFISCKWNGKAINCCKNFMPIATEYGTCYSINNKHAEGLQTLFVSSTNQYETGTLELVLAQDYEAFLHSVEDVPFWNMEYDCRIATVYGSQATVLFSIMDVVNEPELKLITPAVRQCRFPDEVPENFIAYKQYSYSVCIIQCRIDAQLELCNCTHHLTPKEYKNKYCDLEGLKCLTKHYRTLRKLKVPNSNETALECNCLPSCTEPDYNVVAKKLTEPQRDLKVGTITFILSNRPYQRVTRQVARTTLDLVVAIGNCIGLCFGGSLLSIVEIVYYLCFKRWRILKEK
ncbi:sodium channel protein Nach-like [Aphomia sociella]